jgi:hypothetical protein
VPTQRHRKRSHQRAWSVEVSVVVARLRRPSEMAAALTTGRRQQPAPYRALLLRASPGAGWGGDPHTGRPWRPKTVAAVAASPAGGFSAFADFVFAALDRNGALEAPMAAPGAMG